MNVPFANLPLNYTLHRQEYDEAVQKVMSHAQFILGPEVTSFEGNWARFCNTSHAVGVGSGTDALQLILRGLDIGPGDEVITVANTFIATAEAISYTGAKPVLVDCDLNTHLIDPQAVEAAITLRTKAILPVHLYGQPADMDTLSTIAERHGLALVEDAAQAHAATLADGRRCGSLGIAAGFSFYPGKNLGAFGDGGAVTSSNEALVARIRLLRNWGSVVKYHHEVQGYNSRLDTLQAAVLDVKLRHLERWTNLRRAAVASYRSQLHDCPALVLPAEASWTGVHAYHLLVIRLTDHDRDLVARQLGAQGIQTVVHYPVPIHLQKAYAELGQPRGSLPNAEKAAESILSLPLFPEITEEQITHVCTQLRQVLSRSPQART